MTQSVKGLLPWNEDPGSVQGQQWAPALLALGRQRRQADGPTTSFNFSGAPCLKNEGGKQLRKVPGVDFCPSQT